MPVPKLWISALTDQNKNQQEKIVMDIKVQGSQGHVPKPHLFTAQPLCVVPPNPDIPSEQGFQFPSIHPQHIDNRPLEDYNINWFRGSRGNSNGYRPTPRPRPPQPHQPWQQYRQPAHRGKGRRTSQDERRGRTQPFINQAQGARPQKYLQGQRHRYGAHDNVNRWQNNKKRYQKRKNNGNIQYNKQGNSKNGNDNGNSIQVKANLSLQIKNEQQVQNVSKDLGQQLAQSIVENLKTQGLDQNKLFAGINKVKIEVNVNSDAVDAEAVGENDVNDTLVSNVVLSQGPPAAPQYRPVAYRYQASPVNALYSPSTVQLGFSPYTLQQSSVQGGQRSVYKNQQEVSKVDHYDGSSSDYGCGDLDDHLDDLQSVFVIDKNRLEMLGLSQLQDLIQNEFRIQPEDMSKAELAALIQNNLHDTDSKNFVCECDKDSIESQSLDQFKLHKQLNCGHCVHVACYRNIFEQQWEQEGRLSCPVCGSIALYKGDDHDEEDHDEDHDQDMMDHDSQDEKSIVEPSLAQEIEDNMQHDSDA